MFKKLSSLCAFSFGILLPSGFAATLTLDPGASTFLGTEVADTSTLTFAATSPNVSGTLDQRVYREAGGTLDFYYLVTNSSASAVPVVRLTSTDFAGYSVAVAYLTIPVGGIPPTEADRSPAGDTIGLDVFLVPGAGSEWLEISTSAKSFALTGVTRITDADSTRVGSFTTYSPTPVPEPAGLCLLAAGLAGFACLAMHRNSARAVIPLWTSSRS